MPWFTLYILVLIGSFGVSVFLCAQARRLGLRWGLMDKPSGRKAHLKPIAMTGGWGLFGAFMIIVAGGVAVSGPLAARLPSFFSQIKPYLNNIVGIRGEILAVLAGTSLVFIVGLWDDVRPLGPWTKLAGQVAATLPLLAAGISIRGFLPAPAGWLLTAVWIVLLTNSFNLLDNMDGLCASVALVICLVLSLAALQAGQLWIPALFLCLAGSLAGFLIFNFHPASLFMGDAGSLTVGYLMAVFSILVTYYQKGVPSGLPVLVPLAVMGVPLFDTLSVMFIRWRAGRPLMVGDRNHFSHRLLAMGFTVREAAAAIALLTGATGLLALPLRFLGLRAALIHLAGMCMLFGVIVSLELVGRLRK
jgi:UDP-GlcNAc:undecaprenyl-phosphate/decaprenyl-phosphate GlcNAc-1-phosphate transferase